MYTKYIKLCSYDLSVEQEVEYSSLSHTEVLCSEVSIHCPPWNQISVNDHPVCNGWKNK